MSMANNRQVAGNHYVNLDVQPWEAMEAWMSPAEFAGALRGAVIKYIARAGSKGPALQDYRKAEHYLQKLIEFEMRREMKVSAESATATVEVRCAEV